MLRVSHKGVRAIVAVIESIRELFNGADLRFKVLGGVTEPYFKWLEP